MTDAQPSRVPGEAETLARWCRMLPELEEAAAAGGWLSELREQAAFVASGGTASEAFGALGFQGGARREARFPELPGLARPEIPAGIYRCPTGRCERSEGRTPEGRVPICQISGSRLTLRAEA